MDHENEDRPPVTEKGDYKPWGLDENAFRLLLHLSRLPGYGIAPLVIWLIGNLISARSFTEKVTEKAGGKGFQQPRLRACRLYLVRNESGPPGPDG